MGLARLTKLALAFVCLTATAAGCGSKSPVDPDPLPPVVGPLALSCPANIAAETGTTSATVSFTTPTPTGGSVPYTVSCSPASGAAFNLGTTTVNCQAADTLQRAAACQFSVTVTAIPRLQGTNFTAFGDSITEGEIGGTRPAAINTTLAWPARLQTLLAARYKAQSIVVASFGVSGETLADQGDQQGGVSRLSALLDQVHPDALLFLEGINDISETGADGLDNFESNIQAVVNIARGKGVGKLFLSNLLPKTTCYPGTAGCNDANREYVVAANERLRSVVLASNGYALLVDNYGALVTNVNLYIGVDGLHPTADGHEKIAATFFDSIRNNFELPPATLSIRR